MEFGLIADWFESLRFPSPDTLSVVCLGKVTAVGVEKWTCLALSHSSIANHGDVFAYIQGYGWLAVSSGAVVEYCNVTAVGVEDWTCLELSHSSIKSVDEVLVWSQSCR